MLDAPKESSKDLSTVLADLDETLHRLETASARKNHIIAILVIMIVILGSGWWLSALDHRDTRHNGTVADCRAVAFSGRLDDFIAVATKSQTMKAAEFRLAHEGSMTEAYFDCLHPKKEK